MPLHNGKTWAGTKEDYYKEDNSSFEYYTSKVDSASRTPLCRACNAAERTIVVTSEGDDGEGDGDCSEGQERAAKGTSWSRVGAALGSTGRGAAPAAAARTTGRVGEGCTLRQAIDYANNNDPLVPIRIQFASGVKRVSRSPRAHRGERLH